MGLTQLVERDDRVGILQLEHDPVADRPAEQIDDDIGMMAYGGDPLKVLLGPLTGARGGDRISILSLRRKS